MTDHRFDQVLYDVIDVGNQVKIALITLNVPEKLNSWTDAVIDGFTSSLNRANVDSTISAAIMTGTGRYFSSGADFSGNGVAWISTMRNIAKTSNHKIFEAFIAMNKPLVVAINGGAVGGAVTAPCSLCDNVLCVPQSTFHCPFKTLGISAEGCSEFTFPLRLEKEGAKTLLVEGKKVSAIEALQMNLVQEIVEDPSLLLQVALSRTKRMVLAKRQRWRIVPAFQHEIETTYGGNVNSFVAKLREVNEFESQRLATAIFSKEFFKAQMQGAERTGRTKLAWIFWVGGLFVPLISRL
jgi:peroxisomal 3,2-trans-enoyl-CoA isomerase